ncbi:MAG TPA: DUF4337 family protein [Methylovirgula sp.]|nr:DUF4337 family protein [Methylovirgula sp.]
MTDAPPTEHFEHAEHAEHAAESRNPFLAIVAVTIAVLAVVAAGVGSLETIETAATIGAKNDAVLLQDKATDIWNFFQAKSIKKNMYQIAAAAGGANAEDFKQQAKRNGDDEQALQSQGRALEAQRDAKLEQSERHEHRHAVLTIAVTLLQISIAIATISIVRRGARWPWYVALALGFAGMVGAAFAYI